MERERERDVRMYIYIYMHHKGTLMVPLLGIIRGLYLAGLGVGHGLWGRLCNIAGRSEQLTSICGFGL